jgi:hypothetical protein
MVVQVDGMFGCQVLLQHMLQSIDHPCENWLHHQWLQNMKHYPHIPRLIISNRFFYMCFVFVDGVTDKSQNYSAIHHSSIDNIPFDIGKVLSFTHGRKILKFRSLQVDADSEVTFSAGC